MFTGGYGGKKKAHFRGLPSVDDIGLENSAETRRKRGTAGKATRKATRSASEQRLLSLFQQLPEHEQHRLIEELEASHRQRQHNLENAED